jgi:hypothetical protein
MEAHPSPEVGQAVSPAYNEIDGGNKFDTRRTR